MGDIVKVYGPCPHGYGWCMFHGDYMVINGQWVQRGVTAMAEEQADATKEIEDKINSFLDGTTREFDLRVMLFLRRRWPHQSTQETQLAVDIIRERKK